MRFAYLLLTLFIFLWNSHASARSNFENFAKKGCIAEGKYNAAICGCNAAYLDKNLTDEEKKFYVRSSQGDQLATMALLPSLDKIFDAINRCR